MIKKILYLLLILTVPLILYLLSLETVIPIPHDDNHLKLTTEAECFSCHGEGREFARTKEHPPKDRCFKCHTLEKK